MTGIIRPPVRCCRYHCLAASKSCAIASWLSFQNNGRHQAGGRGSCSRDDDNVNTAWNTLCLAVLGHVCSMVPEQKQALYDQRLATRFQEPECMCWWKMASCCGVLRVLPDKTLYVIVLNMLLRNYWDKVCQEQSHGKESETCWGAGIGGEQMGGSMTLWSRNRWGLDWLSGLMFRACSQIAGRCCACCL